MSKKNKTQKASTKPDIDKNKINSKFPIYSTFPDPFEDLSSSEKTKIINDIAETSDKEIPKLINKIQKIFKEYYPIDILSIISYSGLTVGAGENGIIYKDESEGILQPHVEILQALILNIPDNQWGDLPASPDIIQSVWDSLVKLCKAFSLSRINTVENVQCNKEKAIHKIQESIRLNTQSVRNWGYHSQIYTITKELYSHFDKLLISELNFSASNIIDVFESMLNIMETKISEWFKTIQKLKKIDNPKDLVKKYCELIGDNNFEEVYKHFSSLGFSLDIIFQNILHHYFFKMINIYTVDIKTIAKLKNINTSNIQNILNLLSYSPGDLHDKNNQYFFLENPIWTKPIINFEKEYFCSMPQLFFSFILPILDGIIEKINKKELHKRRANYLEYKIEEIVKSRFPEANIISGVEWYYNNIKYETDLIVFIDSHAIIIEAKSHRITQPALRGATDRLKRHIKHILIDPSIQSKRLEVRLNELINDSSIDDSLRDKLPVDLSKIHKVIRVSVTLEDFASLQINLHKIKDTGWFNEDFHPCPTMNLADFQTLFDLLEHPVHIIHYLQRRTEMDSNIEFVGCELDLMALYLGNLLNLIEPENKEKQTLIICDMHFELNKYYDSKDCGFLLDKPKPITSKLFEDILSTLEKRSPHRWTEMGVILNRFHPEDQLKLTSFINEIIPEVNSTWQVDGHRNIIVYSPPSFSEYALCYVLFKDTNIDKRYYFFEQASRYGLEPEHVKYCLVIGKNIDKDDLPYHFIALYDKN